MPLKFWKSTVSERVADLETLLRSAEARILRLEEKTRPELKLEPSRRPRKAPTTPRCTAVNADGTACKGGRHKGLDLCVSHQRAGHARQNGIAPSLVL